MSEPLHHDPIEDNIETHPVKLAIGVVVGAAALIVGIILVAQFAISAYGSRPAKEDPAMKPELVAQRIAPVASVVVDEKAVSQAPAAAPGATAPAATKAPAVPPPAAKPAASAANGKTTYDTVCMACHASGVAGAPKFGDKAAWAPRIKQGLDALHNSALKGKGAMPPKGGNASLSDDAVKAAVDYMAAAAK
jgi:cytochrome c5